MPAINDVTDQKQLATGIGFEKGMQLGGFASASAQMHIRDPKSIPAFLLHQEFFLLPMMSILYLAGVKR
jgi:hypothetical protein